jgi:hypothetical protein
MPVLYFRSLPPVLFLQPRARRLWFCIHRIAEIKILAPRGNPAADQVHDDCIVRDSPRSISSPSHIPVPLDGRLSSVGRNEDILYRDSQIAKLLEITGHRCLHFVSGHMSPWRNQFPAWKPVRCGNSKIMLLPRLYLPVHEVPDLHRVIVLSHRLVLFPQGLRAPWENIASRGEKRGPACQPFAFGRTQDRGNGKNLCRLSPRD